MTDKGSDINAKMMAAVKTTAAIAQAIHDVKEIPSGHLYATLMPHLTLEEYEGAIGLLLKAKLVAKSKTHLLTWIGPAMPAEAT